MSHLMDWYPSMHLDSNLYGRSGTRSLGLFGPAPYHDRQDSERSGTSEIPTTMSRSFGRYSQTSCLGDLRKRRME